MDTSNWKWFNYTDLFGISGSKTTPKEELETYGRGEYPYVTTQAVNNGVENFYNYCTEKGGVLTVDSAVLGFCSYQEKDFSASDHVEVLTPKFKLNKYIALFLTTIINREQYRYSYGRKCSQIKLKKSRIKLPVTIEGEPDWKYMEDFVKDTIIPQLPKKAQKVWLKKYDTTPQKQEKMKLNTEDWKWFVLDSLFTINRGKTLTSDDKEYYIGDIPCVNGTSTNNGVLCYLSDEIEALGFKKQPVPSLSLCRVGTSGLTFVQTKPYYIADNAFCLQLKEQQNVYVYLFLSSILDKECIKYCYGRTISSEKYMQTCVKLPVTAEGKPDWKFMEDYIKSLPYSKNLEPSDPNEVVDELIEVKKEMIKLRHELKAHHEAQEVQVIGGNVTYIDNSTNYTIKK